MSERVTSRSSNSPNSLPKSHENGIEGLNAVGSGGLGQGSEGEGCDSSHLLLLIHEPILHNLHQTLQVRQHSTAHQDGYLLHYLDTWRDTCVCLYMQV